MEKDQEQKNAEEIAIRNRQQQTDPQLTELKGFFDSGEKLEPTIEADGQKKDEQGERQPK